MAIIDSVVTFVNRHQLITPDAGIVIGLSGGPDSVFLLHFLHTIASQYNLSLIAAHLNHEWRSDADKDVEFCKNLCATYNVAFVTKRMSELDIAFPKHSSPESRGRIARRHFFETARQEYNMDVIALGHHAQDQLETFFIRLIRGTSLTGLCSMYSKKGHYIRPLLSSDKSDIVQFLTAHSIPFLIDPTNEQLTFLRNKIRKELLPVFATLDSRAFKNTLVTIDRLQDTEDLLNGITDHTLQQMIVHEPDIHWLRFKQVLNLHPVLQHRCIIQWLIKEKVPFTPSEGLLDEIIRFFGNPEQRHEIHKYWILEKKNDLVKINVSSS